MKNYLSKEQSMLMDIVSRFGCVSLDQAYILMKPADKRITIQLINMLIKNNYISLVQNKYLTIKGSEDKLNRDVINCIWAMMALSKYDKKVVIDSMRAVKPAVLFFSMNDKETFEVIPLNNSKLINIKATQDMYEAKMSKFSDIVQNWYVFVIEDPQMLMKLKQYQLPFKFIVALIGEVKENGYPDVKFKKSVPQP